MAGQLNIALGGYPWVVVDTQWVALPISTVGAVAVGLVTKRMDEDHLNRCLSPRPAVVPATEQAHRSAETS